MSAFLALNSSSVSIPASWSSPNFFSLSMGSEVAGVDAVVGADAVAGAVVFARLFIRLLVRLLAPPLPAGPKLGIAPPY